MDPQEANKFMKNTLMETLKMECVEIGDGIVKMKMPVDASTHQPMGLLHGGASAALIESIGSLGSALLVDLEKEAPVGVEVNANHLTAMRSGFVVATGKLVHKGKRTHVWQVDLHPEGSDRLVCTGRLTVMLVPVR